jgi:hypothetical protein
VRFAPELAGHDIITAILTPARECRYRCRNDNPGRNHMRQAAFALALLAASPAGAEPLLHPMFADHTVLQRDKPIRIYGQARPGTEVSLRLGDTNTTARASAGGEWTATLPAMAGGGPLHIAGE